MRCTLLAIPLVLAAWATPARAQYTVDPNQSFAWSESTGWMNWYVDGGRGVIVNPTYLEGHVWTENTGWIDLGDGSPANGVSYANVDDTDYGVNVVLGTGGLSGMAWGEGIGWINFAGGALATPPVPARVGGDCRLYGYVWGAAIGWITLDDAAHYVALLLDGDTDRDGDVDLTDLAVLLANFDTPSGATRAEGDFDEDGDVDLTDLAVLLSSFDAACS